MGALADKLSLSKFAENLDLVTSSNFNNVYVDRVRLLKNENQLVMDLNSKTIINQGELIDFVENFKGRFKKISDIEMNIYYNLDYTNTNDLISLNWDNILFIIRNRAPSITSIEDNIEWRYKNNTLNIMIDEPILMKKVQEKKVEKKITKYFKQYFNINLKCKLVAKADDTFNLQDYEQEKSKAESHLMREIMKGFSQQGKDGGNNKHHANQTPTILYGRRIKEEPIPLYENISEFEHMVIEGEVFSLNKRELRNGSKLIILQITDYTNSATVKIFQRKRNSTQEISLGDRLRVRGKVTFDKFLKESVIIASDILYIPKEEKGDLSSKKRIELHLHTQMSSMDGVSKTSDLIEKAADWGHKAIAITDHGVVQAYPEAMLASKKHDIKVIYGLEGYLVDDVEKIVEAGDDTYSFNDEYVVVDIETTGLSNLYDRITEIGAVRVKNQQIVDSFSTLVNPGIDIPTKITELTGISNNMVRNAPRIEEVLPKFFEFVANACLVAHNADFDLGFLRENAKKINYKITNRVVDTLKLSRILLKKLRRHRLNVIARELNISLENHHRAMDDARATAKIFLKFIELMSKQGINTLQDINLLLTSKVDFKKLNSYHVILLAKNKKGLQNLYNIVSQSHINFFYKNPRIPRSLLNKYREGILIGSACQAGELYQAILSNLPDDYIENIAKYYDYLEIQPLENNEFLIDKGLLRGYEDLKNINIKIVKIGDKLNIPVVATGDVHFLNKHDEYYRRILMAGQGYSDADNQAPLYLKTTEEMLQEFAYLGENRAHEVVVDNTQLINNRIQRLVPIPDGTFPPQIEGAEEEFKRLCYSNAEKIYGKALPTIVKERLDKEVSSIVGNGYAVMYIIAHKLVDKSLKDGYLVGSRGSVGSSFAATMSDITEVNPLPPHYICGDCKYSEFITDGRYGSGIDLPDKNCPKCGMQLTKEGHDIPFEVFLGFEGNKEPDIDLNFASEYQAEAHKYTEELFGEGKVFRAGTIGTIADKTAYGFVKKYMEAKDIDCSSAEINRLTLGCAGVRRTSGQHPGGVIIVPEDRDIHEFTPIQYPANDGSSGVITTHFDYHSIEGRLLKLDILGHDVPSIIKMLEDITGFKATNIPMDDETTMSIFTSTKALKINCKKFKCKVGTLGIPEFGTRFVRQMLLDTNPKTFAELVRISGLSHGTGVWINNAQRLVRDNTAELKDVISTRDDIMNYLILKGLPSKTSFEIMENVRRGKGLKKDEEELMRYNNVPDWYINSCKKIEYMFPKAHAVAYVMMSFRIAYYKLYYPIAFYAAYFTMKAEDFDIDIVAKGKEKVIEKIDELEGKGNDTTAKERNLLTVLEVVWEMYARGINILAVDLYKSHPDKFIIKNNNLLPPLKSLQGMGQNAAASIERERKKGEFLSIEDLQNRTKITKTVIETLLKHGCIEGLPSTNQLSFF